MDNGRSVLRKTLTAAGTALLICAAVLMPAARADARNYGLKKYSGNRWELIKKDHLNKKTDRLIMVKYRGGSKAVVQMWIKEDIPEKETETAETQKEETAAVQTETTAAADDDNAVYGSSRNRSSGAAVKKQWKMLFSVNGYVGRNGINKVRQGDVKTPTGQFNISLAFGIKKSPGTAGIKYKKLNKYHYWSGEKSTYNTFVDVRKIGRKSIAGEHLITYVPFYNYALAMDFNKQCVYRKGSAIFMHCTKPGRPYTGGCIAVTQSRMKQVVQNTTKNTKIFIYPE